jgi:hypothetical protein
MAWLVAIVSVHPPILPLVNGDLISPGGVSTCKSTHRWIRFTTSSYPIIALQQCIDKIC